MVKINNDYYYLCQSVLNAEAKLKKATSFALSADSR